MAVPVLVLVPSREVDSVLNMTLLHKLLRERGFITGEHYLIFDEVSTLLLDLEDGAPQLLLVVARGATEKWSDDVYATALKRNKSLRVMFSPSRKLHPTQGGENKVGGHPFDPFLTAATEFVK